MSNIFQNRVIRPVRLFAHDVVLDGLLNISLGGRTLDELNLAARGFLTLTSPRLVAGSRNLDGAPVLVSKNATMLVLEIPDLGATLGGAAQEVEIRSHGRAAVRLSLGTMVIEGYVHVGPGADALLRLNQATHPFIAIQHASVTGEGQEFSAPFLAVNRSHILWAQELYSVSAVPEEVVAGAAEESR